MAVETVRYVEVAAEADLAEGQMRAVQVGGKRVLLALVEGRPYAMGAVCTHERANLDEGSLMGHEIYCPLHFSCFDVRTGEALAPPADRDAQVYAVKVEDGKVLVSDAPVDPDDLEEAAEDGGAPTAEAAEAEAAEAEAVETEAPEGDGAAEPAATESNGTAQPAATESNGTARPAATESNGTAQPAAAESNGTGEPAAPEPVAGAESNGAAEPATTPEPVAAARPAAAPEPATPDCAPVTRPSIHARVIERIEAQGWLETGAQWLGTALRPVRESRLGGHVFDMLHGRLMGHALHPALSDLPIGLWAGAILLEVVGEPDPAAILAAGGVVAGLATAATGVADWSVSDGRDRRVGLLHGITQTVALTLVAGSVALHLADIHEGAVVLLVAGTGLSMSSAYLGGHLVLGRGVMVDHTAWTVGPRAWTRALKVDAIAEDGAEAAEVDGRRVLLSRTDGVVSAIEDACSHAGGPLSRGAVRDGVVTCPWHGSCFRLRDGAVVKGPAQNPQPMLETRVRDGWIEVRAPRR